MKRCSVCHEMKVKEDFHSDASRRDGLMIRCKACECARLKAAYRRKNPPPPLRPVRLCSRPGCNRRHLALDLCKPHYKQLRRAEGKDGGDPAVSLIGAAVHRPSGLVEQRVIKVHVAGGLYWPICPNPYHGPVRMAALPVKPGGELDMTATPEWTWRFCGCGARVVLNEEELSWAIYEARSMRRSSQAV